MGPSFNSSLFSGTHRVKHTLCIVTWNARAKCVKTKSGYRVLHLPPCNSSRKQLVGFAVLMSTLPTISWLSCWQSCIWHKIVSGTASRANILMLRIKMTKPLSTTLIRLLHSQPIFHCHIPCQRSNTCLSGIVKHSHIRFPHPRESIPQLHRQQ